MATVTFAQTDNRITGKLTEMIGRARDARGFLQRVILPMYLEDQKKRFQSENNTETGQWAALNPKYEKLKKTKYAGFPGSGNAILVGTGKLSDAVLLVSGGNKVITQNSITISVDSGVVPYAKYVQEKRQFMSFGGSSINQFKDAIRLYLMGHLHG